MLLIGEKIGRRSFGKALVGAAMLPALAGSNLLASAGEASAAPGSGPWALNPTEQLDLLVRVMASSKGEDCTWYYSGRIFGQVGDQAPKPLFGYAGSETYWADKQADGTYTLSASTFSYPTELDSDLPLTSFKNPYTGEDNTPVPNLYRSDQSSWLTEAGMIHAPGLEPDPLRLQLSEVGDTLMMTHDVGQAKMPQPHRELSTKFISIRDIKNRAIAKLPGVSAELFISRWPSWMKMGDRPGHSLWQLGAKKVFSRNEIPAVYLRRTLAEHPTHLSARPGTKGSTSRVY